MQSIKMKKILIIIIGIFPLILIGQRQASNWYFGQGSGLSFNTEPPTVLSDGRLFTFEGCATISNKKGELLFYTDGITVYNKLHRPMPNGFSLLGDPSSSQSAIIVPKPEDENIYYIFTVGVEFPGLRYTSVDISLDGGNGDVVFNEKNIQLLPFASEKITAVKHLDGSSIWVIAFDGGLFHSYKISSNGINRKSVKSILGDFISDPRGYLKASPNGEYLAMANHSSSSYLLSFFAASGRVFPNIQLEFEELGENAYGVEFSAESRKLYVDTFIQESSDDPDNPKNTRYLHQFDLNTADVQGSRILIDTREDTYRGALQLAINGKIYRALSSQYLIGSRYLGVINNPELDGVLCDYQHNAIDLSPGFRGNLSTQGLPPFIQSLFFFTINVKNACINQASDFELNTIEENYSVLWDFGDGSTSTDINPTHQYLLPGVYPVSATMLLSTGESKTINKMVQIFEVPNLNSNQTLEQCDNDNDGIANFNLNEAYSLLTSDVEQYTLTFYQSLTDLNNDVPIDASLPYKNSLSNPQELWVKATNQIGCSETTNLFINAINISLGTIPPLVSCDGSDNVEDDDFGLFDLELKRNDIRNQFGLSPNIIISYYKSESDAELESNAIQENEFLSKSQIIWVRAEAENQNCIGIEQVSLIVNKLPLPNLDKEYSICLNLPNVPLTINGGDNYDAFEWREEESNTVFSTNQIVNIFRTGNYSLTSYLTENGLQCSRTQSFTVEPSNIATFETIEVVDATQNNTITVLVSGEGVYEYRLLDQNNVIYAPYQKSNTFENVFPGIYTISVRDTKNNCGVVQNQVSVIGFPKFFTPNNDGVHDTWQVLGISNMFQPNTNILIYNRFGKLIKQLNPLGNGWDGLFNGKKLPADDYWFSVTLQDGRVFKNHFTLKY